MIATDLANFIRNQSGAWCDDCIAEVLRLKRRQQAQHVTSTLAVSHEFSRDMGVCSRCGQVKLVTRTNRLHEQPGVFAALSAPPR